MKPTISFEKGPRRGVKPEIILAIAGKKMSWILFRGRPSI
jgi:hypothetical protein